MILDLFAEAVVAEDEEEEPVAKEIMWAMSDVQVLYPFVYDVSRILPFRIRSLSYTTAYEVFPHTPLSSTGSRVYNPVEYEGPLGFEGAQHRPTPRPSVKRICRKALFSAL